MSKKENEREVTSLLARIRESLKRPKKESMDSESSEDSFDRELSERLEKHLNTDGPDTDLREGETEPDFAVDELEIVADGALNPDEVEQSFAQEQDEEAVDAAEKALFSDLDALMARMTPEQRAMFEAEMNAADEADEAFASVEEFVVSEVTEVVGETEKNESVEEIAVIAQTAELQEKTDTEKNEADVPPQEDQIAANVEIAEEAVSAQDSEIAEDSMSEDGEVYVSPDEDEEYDLPETEAFRALEARMTPEQRAQFEQALAEAQEAERAEKAERAARREAERLAAEQAAYITPQSEPENGQAIECPISNESEVEATEELVEEE